MKLRSLTFCVLPVALVTVFVALRAAVPKRSSEKPWLIYTAAPSYDALAWMRGGERFPQGATLMLKGVSARPLVPGLAASADATVSFDGTKVLFAGKKAATDRWQIWEMPLEGGEAVQLTECADDCVRPLYLPDDRIVYARKIHGAFQIETSPAIRGAAVDLTNIPGNALPTDVLHDGRILFEAAYPLGEGATAEIYTMYPDGSGVEAYRCDHGDSRYEGKQDAAGDIVFVNQKGLGRFTSAFAHELQVSAPAGQFADAVQGHDGRWIVSWRNEPNSRYSLQHWAAATKGLMPMASAADRDLVQPVIVGPREIPNRFPSALHDWDGANVLCLNVYTSKLAIPGGSVKSVKVYTLADGNPKLLGRAPVEDDGSFFVHVPSGQPIRMELLDGTGNVVQSEKGWFWMARGEQRVCVGCHAGPERAPENAVPQVLVKSTEPADMTQQVTASKGGH
jgi:hypothetical protein